jgi:hypothetical protein
LFSVDGAVKAVKKSGSTKSIDVPVRNGTYHAGMEFDSNGQGNGNAVVKGMNGGVDVDGVVSEMRRRTRVIDNKSSEKRGKKASTAKVTVVEQTELERLGKIDWEIPRKTLHSSIGERKVFWSHVPQQP